MIRILEHRGYPNDAEKNIPPVYVEDKEFRQEFYLEGMPADVRCFRECNDAFFVQDNKIVAVRKFLRFDYCEHKIRVQSSRRQPRKEIYVNDLFGKCVLLYKGNVTDCYLNGKKVGYINRIGDLCNHIWYWKHCRKYNKKRAVVSREIFAEFDETVMPTLLIAVLVEAAWQSVREFS